MIIDTPWTRVGQKGFVSIIMCEPRLQRPGLIECVQDEKHLLSDFGRARSSTHSCHYAPLWRGRTWISDFGEAGL